MTAQGEAQTCEWQSCLERCGVWAAVAREVCAKALVRGSSPVWHTHHEVAEDLG